MSLTSDATVLDTENYQFLTDYVYRESGIVLDKDKHYLLEARLMPVVQDSHLASLSALCDALRAGGASPLRQKVVEAMTTHETLFFRDSTPFEGLKNEILAQLTERQKMTRKLSFWSAAASRGQEAYSLAILLLEAGLATWNLNILGTDLSAAILERARQGRYMQLEMNRGLPAVHLVKYFERDGLDWKIKDHVRKMVRYEQFDLRKSMAGKGPFDLIFCRNVLIYFDIPTKRQILAGLRRALRPGGYLVLGSAESTLNLDEAYKRVQVGRATFYQAPES